MYDPAGISLWHVLGLAVRVGLGMGLHRKAEGGDGKDEELVSIRIPYAPAYFPASRLGERVGGANLFFRCVLCPSAP